MHPDHAADYTSVQISTKCETRTRPACSCFVNLRTALLCTEQNDGRIDSIAESSATGEDANHERSSLWSRSRQLRSLPSGSTTQCLSSLLRSTERSANPLALRSLLSSAAASAQQKDGPRAAYWRQADSSTLIAYSRSSHSPYQE